jgi:hypothetical protein
VAGAGGSWSSAGNFGTGGLIIGDGSSITVDAGPDACGGSALTAVAKKVNILLVVDKSGSMKTTPPGFTTDKWTALKTALSASLDKVKGGISFGMILFPMSLDPTAPILDSCLSAKCCEMPQGPPSVTVPFDVGTTSVPAILAALDNNPPAGGTPTSAALQGALDYFTYGPAKDLQGDNYILLATDGAPNCNTALACAANRCTSNIEATCTGAANCCLPPNQMGCVDDAKTTALISALQTKGISTFVIGIPGTELYSSFLDAFAVAGGKPASSLSPQYYAVSAAGGVSGLTDVFTAITTVLIKACDLTLASTPPDETLLNVSVDGVVISQTGPNGWGLDKTTTPPTIKIKGTTCQNIQTNGANSLQVIYGCPTYAIK